MNVRSDIEGRKSEELRKRLEIEGVAHVIRKSRLGWFGHLERTDAGDWVSACRNVAILENAGKVKSDRKRGGMQL